MLVVLYQDIKFREVSFILFPILFLIIAYFTSVLKPFEMIIEDMLMIIGFLIIQVAIITLYLLIKFQKALNPFAGFIGTGDLLFWLAIAPLFSFANFLLFFVSSLSFSSLIFTTFKGKLGSGSTSKARLVPLAGIQAAFLLLMLLLNHLFWNVEFHQGYALSYLWQI